MTHHGFAQQMLVSLLLSSLVVSCGGTPTVSEPTATAIPPVTPSPRMPLATPAAEEALEVLSPEEVVHIFFAALQSTEPDAVDDQFMSTYFTDYYSSTEFSPDMVGAFAYAELAFHEPIEIDENNAIVKVDVSEAGYRVSIVVFVKRVQTWKVDALRSLALPGFVHVLREELVALEDPSPDEQRQLKDINRLFATDEELAEAFEQNKVLFIETAECFYSQDEITAVYAPFLAEGDEGYTILMDGEAVPVAELNGAWTEYGVDRETVELLVTAVEQLDLYCIERDYVYESNIHFSMGGIMDNSLGYIYAPDDDVPPIDHHEYFYIERIDEHWYIYRTT
jgi:hypothetical protein